MRNRNALEFIGIQRVFYNPNFNRVQSDTFKNEVGLNRFTMIPSKWIEVTEAIGFVSNTIGAVTGGLAGILWDVPKKRTDKLKNKECIEKCLF